MKPNISVIIPTYNEKDHIKKCLESLLEQEQVTFEIIVVDDGSTDETLEIIESFIKKNRHINLKVLTQNHQGPGMARNKATWEAQGKILVFVDADMTFEKNFINSLTFPILNSQTKGTFSSNEWVANWENKISKAWSLIRGFEDGRMHPKNYPNKQPVFRAILKTEFEKVGGFEPNRGYDDDWSLSEKLGYQADNVLDAKFYHYNPDSLSEIFVQSKWLAKRQYKFGILGKIFTLIKTFLLFSVINGIVLTMKYKLFTLLLVKVVSDLGVSVGIIESIITKKSSR